MYQIRCIFLQRKNITIQVRPFTQLRGYLISDLGDVASMVNIFDDLRELVLDAAKFTELLAVILGEYRRKDGTHE